MHLYHILPYLTSSEIYLTMNNESLFLAFAGSELSLASKALLIQESLESKFEPLASKKSIEQTNPTKKKSSLTSPGFPVLQQSSERLSE